MSRYYADYVPPPSRERERERSPRRPEYERDYYKEREYESSSRRYERRSRSPDPRYERRPSPRRYERERERERDPYYDDRRYEKKDYYDDRRYEPSSSRRSPPPRVLEREETKKSEYEIEYDPKTRTFQGPGMKPLPAYASSKSLPVPKAKSDDGSSLSKRRKMRKGPIANYFDPDILPNEKVICPYNNAHIVQRKRLQGHLLYCRKKFPNPDLKICPLNVLHVVKEDELESHILKCPDREIVKYLSFEPDFERESPPRQGLIESSENWDDDVVIDYDPNIQIEKFRKIAEEADKEGYIPPEEMPSVEPIVNATSPAGSTTVEPVDHVEINGTVIKIKREKTENEDANENETMALLDEQLKEPEPILKPVLVSPRDPEPKHYERMPEIRVKKEWSPIPRRRSPSPRKRVYSPPRAYLERRRSPSPRRRSPSPRRRSPSLRRRSPSPRRRSPSPRRRSPNYYKMLSPPPRVKREPDDNGYLHSRDRFDTSRRYEKSPPPLYRVKDEYNGGSRQDPYAKYEDSRKSRYDEYYSHKPDPYYDERKSSSSKDLYSKHDEYDRRPRYDERRRSPSPRAYPAAYRPRSRSPGRYERPRSRSPGRYERPRSRSPGRYERPRSRSPGRYERPISRSSRSRTPRSRSRHEKEYEREYERRRTPPPIAPPKSSKDYYECPTYGSMIANEKDYRKNSEKRIKIEKTYSPPPKSSYKVKAKETRKSPEVADEDIVYTRQA